GRTGSQRNRQCGQNHGVVAIHDAEDQHRRQRQHRPNRQVDPLTAGEHDEGLPCRRDPQECRQPQNIDRLVNVDKPGPENPAEQEERNRQQQRDEGRVKPEQPECVGRPPVQSGSVVELLLRHVVTCCLRTSRTMPGPASAAMMMSASTRVCDQRGTFANEIMLRMRPRMITPRIDPATPPCPPLSRVPPITTATIESSVMLVPMYGSPLPVLIVRATAPRAAASPAST